MQADGVKIKLLVHPFSGIPESASVQLVHLNIWKKGFVVI